MKRSSSAVDAMLSGSLALLAGAAVALSPGPAFGQTTGTGTFGNRTATTWRAGSSYDFAQVCRQRPTAPQCQRSGWMHNRSSTHLKYVNRTSHRAYQADLAVREAREKQQMMHRRASGNHEWRLLSKVRGFFAQKMTRVVDRLRLRGMGINREAPFHNTGGFGRHVQRADVEIRGSWLYRKGRIGTVQTSKLQSHDRRKSVRRRPRPSVKR